MIDFLLSKIKKNWADVRKFPIAGSTAQTQANNFQKRYKDCSVILALFFMIVS